MLPPASCRIMTIFIGAVEICFMAGPVGNCSYCCPPTPEDVQFKLYTRSNPSSHEIIRTGDVSSLRSSSYNSQHSTVIYLFGFSEISTGVSTTTIKNAFFTENNYNFILADWSRLIALPWYISALRNTKRMGRLFADFIQFLQEAGIPASSLHVIGFSLGAEAAGFAGKRLKKKGIVIGRITGLDPANPGYSWTDPTARLAKGDAAFVDVIHTNPGVFGLPVTIGDVDFFVNIKEWIQPGCWIDELITNRQLKYFYGCSHNRVWRLFAESVVNPLGFPATRCPDWTSATRRCSFQVDGYMGIAANPTMTGKMFLNTNRMPPFARNGP